MNNLQYIFNFIVALIVGLGGYKALTFIINKIANRKKRSKEEENYEVQSDIDNINNQIQDLQNKMKTLQEQMDQLKSENSDLRCASCKNFACNNRQK